MANAVLELPQGSENLDTRISRISNEKKSVEAIDQR
jgi:hypothetical protein